MNCKSGDLAIVVRCYCPENIGLPVQVLGRGFHDGDGWNWLTVSSGKAVVTGGKRSKFAYCPDAWLRPIRPDGITTEEVKELFSPSPAKESEKV